MAKHNELGKEGETEAAEYLISKGYTIRHRNWRSGKRELDIVAQKDGELVIVEVKTRRNDEFGRPEEAITDRKIRNIIISTDAYIQRFDRPAGSLRCHYSYGDRASLSDRTHRRCFFATHLVRHTYSTTSSQKKNYGYRNTPSILFK